MDRYSGVEIVNVGSGREVSIREAAEMAKQVVGFKLVDGSKLAAEARRRLKAGVETQGLSQGRAGGELQVVLGECG
ncbi:unnamed protein product, partial [Musa banksii]